MRVFVDDSDDGASINTENASEPRNATKIGSVAAHDEESAKNKADETMTEARGEEDLGDAKLHEQKSLVAVEPKVEEVTEEDIGDAKRPSSAGKRKSLYVEDDEDNDDEDGNEGDDGSTMDVDAGWVENDEDESDDDDEADDDGEADDSSTQPKLTTRDIWTYITNAGKKAKKGVHVHRNSHGRASYTGAHMTAMKSKPAPRGLVSRIPISIQSAGQAQTSPPTSRAALKKQRREAKAAAEGQASQQNATPQPASEKPSNTQGNRPERTAAGRHSVPDVPTQPASTPSLEEGREPEPEGRDMKPESKRAPDDI